MARVSKLAVVQKGDTVAVLRQVSKLVPAHFKLGIVLARVVCGWALDDSKLRVVGGKVRDDVPCKLDFLSTRKMEKTRLPR